MYMYVLLYLLYGVSLSMSLEHLDFHRALLHTVSCMYPAPALWEGGPSFFFRSEVPPSC
jgi:hypothetical protein